MELNKLDIFIEIAKQKPKKRVAVAAAEDINVLEAIYAAKANGICDPLLVGDSKKIRENAEKFNIDLTGTEIIEEKNPANASRICVKLIREEKAHIMMKGLVSTAEFLRAILDKENGLRCGNLLSHIGFFDPKRYHKLIAVTDAAQNVAPSLEDKISIINNAVNMFNNLGINRPKIAVLAAVEAVNYKMPACVDAALITMMNKRGQFKNAIIDGPLAFDVAISKEAAKHKGLESEVAGDPDLLLTPDIEAGNILYKSFTYIGGASVAAVILGATAPIVLTSRADTEKSKMMSLALAAASC